MASEYVALYRSMLDGKYISEFETILPQPPLLEKKLNGQRLHNNRSPTAETHEIA
jgi:hypothetical protein